MFKASDLSLDDQGLGMKSLTNQIQSCPNFPINIKILKHSALLQVAIPQKRDQVNCHSVKRGHCLQTIYAFCYSNFAILIWIFNIFLRLALLWGAV